MQKKNDFENYLTDVNKNFLSVKENELKITHLWVDGFGWENTILIEEDFKYIYKINDSKKIAVVLDKISLNYVVLKYKEIKEVSNSSLKKLIDIKIKDVPALKFMALQANKDLKNYIQDVLSEHVRVGGKK